MGNIISLMGLTSRRQALEHEELAEYTLDGPMINQSPREETLLLQTCKQIHEDFIETNPYLYLEKQLVEKDTTGVTIIGDTGDGKTAAAKNVAWKLYRNRGFIPLEVRTIAEIDEIYHPSKNILFLVNDPFGACCVYSEFIRDWAVRLGELDKYLRTGRVKMIVTLRKQIWEECKFDLKRLPPFASIVDMSSSRLTKADRRGILVQHLLSVDIDVEAWSWRWKIDKIVNSGTTLGFPYCCKLVVDRGGFRKDIVNFFDKPFEFIGDELRSLEHNTPILYALLVLLMLNNGSLYLDDLDPSQPCLERRFQQKMCEIFLACNVDKSHTQPTPRQVIQNLDKLTGIYLLKNSTGYVFSHGSLLEAVALEFGKSNHQLLLKYANPEFLVQFVMVESRLCRGSNVGNFVIIGHKFYLKFAEMMTRELLEGHMEITLKNPSWLDPDFHAVWEKHVLTNIDMRDFLSKRGTRWQRSVLHCAAFRGLLPTVDFLIHNLEGTMMTLTDQDGATVLHCAVTGGHADMVRYLIKKGFNPNTPDKAGWTPLYIAALCGHFEVVKLLLVSNADPDICTIYGSSPSYIAALCEHWDIVSLLRSWGASRVEECRSRDLVLLLTQQNDSRVTTLLRAVRAGEQNEVKYMLDYRSSDGSGISVNEANSYGWTALYVSAVCGHFDIASLLLSRGADPEQPTKYGRTPWYVAEVCGHENIVDLIRSYMNNSSRHMLLYGGV